MFALKNMFQVDFKCISDMTYFIYCTRSINKLTTNLSVFVSKQNSRTFKITTKLVFELENNFAWRNDFLGYYQMWTKIN